VDIAVMNRGEAEVLGGSMVPVEAAERLLDAGAGVVVVTLGAEGAMLVGRDCRASLDAPEVQAVDSTGAGDVFCGALVAARSKGLPWKRGLRVAIGAAAVKVTRPGVRASFPTRSELERLMLQATEQEPIEGDMSP
jgi:ribokinase